MYDLLREATLPLHQKSEVIFLASQVVREHHWNLLDDRIVTAALRAEKNPLGNYLSIDVELKQFERIVLVDGTREYVEKLPLHAAQNAARPYKTLGRPETLIYFAQSLPSQPAIARGPYPDSFRSWK